MKRPRLTDATRIRWRRLVGAVLAMSLLATCGVVDSTRIDPVMTAMQTHPVCASGLGTYALPKAFVHVIVQQTGASPPVISGFGTDSKLPVQIRWHPDRSLVFCLDYLASPLAHDVVTVKKFTPGGTPAADDNTTSFLGAVIVNAEDRSVFIVEALVRALFIGLSGDAGFAPRDGTPQPTPQTLADLEYDPFDPRESAEVNARLTSLGYCLVLEGGYTFDRDHGTIDGYCNAPRSHATWLGPIVKAYIKAEETPANPALPGLLYRPRVPYRLAVFHKADPKGTGRWQLSATQVLAMENMSPVLSLDIQRAAFAGRNANFVFDHGALLTACVAKGSEIEGFVDIPLQISRSIVALPTSILKVHIDQVNNETSLTKAETQLLQVQNAYLAALATNNFTPVAGVPSGPTPVSANATSLAIPKDLATLQQGPLPGAAPVYGNDLFAASLASLCQGS